MLHFFHFVKRQECKSCTKRSMPYVSRSGRPYPNIVHNIQSPALKQTRLPYIKILRICRHSRQSVVSNPSASGRWWKVECCMLGYRKACCCTFDSYSALKQTIRPQEWLCHSRLRMVQSLQITGMKQNVLFLQRASMRKLIKGKHEKRCSFLERKGE